MKKKLAGFLLGVMMICAAGGEAYAAEKTKNSPEIQVQAEGQTTGGEDQQPEVSAKDIQIIIGGKEYQTPVASAGKSCVLEVPLVNLGKDNAKDILITPVVTTEMETWPFTIEKTDYATQWSELPGTDSGKNTLDRKHTFRWTLKTRDDVATGSAKISFRVTYKDADGQSYGPEILDYFVQVQGTAPKQESDQETQTAVSTPRVIVTGFTTEPETVYAGDTFQLTLSLKNTSKTTAVKNLLFDIQATQEGSDTQTTSAAFLPTAGSSTIFVDSIGADSSKNITIELKSKADLSQKPYVIQVGMEYEDSKANPFTETASVSIPVKQEAKVDMSTVDLMPGSIEVGGEANVMFSLYNTGKTKLYNVNVKFIADSISGGDTFLGNLEPGATANVDAYLYGIAATMDDGTVKIEIHYEDEEGNPAVIEQSTTVFVSETYMEDYTDDFYPEDMEEETSSSKPMLGIVIGILLVLLCGVVAFLILKVKRKKAKQQETEELELLEDEES